MARKLQEYRCLEGAVKNKLKIMKPISEHIQESILKDVFNRKKRSEDIETLIDTEYFKLSMDEIDNYIQKRMSRLKSETDDKVFKELYDSETPYKEYEDTYKDIDEYSDSTRKKNIFLRLYNQLVDHIKSAFKP